MQPPARRRREWTFLAALLLLVSLHFWFPRVNQGPSHDTYSASADGKKAFYLLADRFGYEVARNQRPLSLLLDEIAQTSYDADTLCLLGPVRYPTDGEWERILEWVAGGGRLLMAARGGATGEKIEFEIPGLEAGVKSGGGPYETLDVEATVADTGEFIWRSGGEVDAAGADGPELLLEAAGTPQVVRIEHGRGEIVLAASDFVFSNQSLAWSDFSNAELAIRLLDAAGGVRVYFDESLNASGTPKVVGLLLEPFLRPVTVQLLIVLLLFAWWRSRPFGPLLPGSVPARHNIVDHTDTLGTLYFKTGDGAAPLKSYLTLLESELRLGSLQGSNNRALSAVAARLGKETAAVRKLFDRARKYAEAGELDRKTAAKIIRRLALIRNAMTEPVVTRPAAHRNESD